MYHKTKNSSLYFCSRVSDQALWSCSPESSNERGVSLSPLHGLRPGRRVQENAAGFVCALSDVISLYILFKNELVLHDMGTIWLIW